MSARDGYEAVIGLEIHAQLLTKSKMFCSCPNSFEGNPNTFVCPVCTGQPGSLPVINQKAIELGIRAALAIGATVHEESIFARKNYFYPDLPKGYQISQYERPYCTGGHVTIRLKGGEEKRIGITRIHFEEDAGKSVHRGHDTLVNLNRAGVPLCEMVSEPDMRTSHEAGQYLRTVRNLFRYAEVCDGNMEKGNFRCDANVSVRKVGAKEFGTKVELKNINSFRFVEKAIEYEIDRQITALESGEKIKQQTRGWNSAKNISEVMREKEQAHDYRYFPEPDLAPLMITPALQATIKSQMPELPEVKRERFKTTFQLTDYDAAVLTASRDLADYYEQVVKITGNAKLSANWIMNELLGRLNAEGLEIESSPVSADHLGSLVQKIVSNELSGKMAKDVFEEMFKTSKAPDVIVKEKGLSQISDTGALEKAIREVIAANPKQAEDFRAGKDKLLGFFVGQVMKATKGQGNPALVNELCAKLLKE